ncbi:hypothetical protein PFISCL1PPCAC_6765, partial [Pristionchus fissidentatus]
FPMSESGRDPASDATLKAVKEASYELDNIVARIKKEGREVRKAIQSRVTSDESIRSDSGKEKRKEKEDRAVIRMRCVTSSLQNDGETVYTRTKRKAVLRPDMEECRLRSDPNKECNVQLRVKVSHSDDPDWTHMTILVMDQNEKLLVVLDLECRGEEARCVRINGIEATPDRA